MPSLHAIFFRITRKTMTVEVFPSSNLAFLSLHLDSPWSFYQFLHWLMACLGNSFACSQSLCFTNQDWNLDVTRRNQTWNKLFVFDVRLNAAGYLATLATCSRANRWAEAGTWAIWTSLTQISSWKVSRASRYSGAGDDAKDASPSWRVRSRKIGRLDDWLSLKDVFKTSRLLREAYLL